MQQVPVLFKNTPENIGHGKDQAGIGDIWELGSTAPVAIEASLDNRS
jgi:hypothetical protein